MGSVQAVAVVVMGTSLALFVWHALAFRAARDEPEEAGRREFARRRFRRRAQVSAMLLVAGLGMLAAAAIDPRAAPLAYSLAWGGVLLLVAWMALLAVGDAVASRVQAERELRHERQACAALEAEARRLQASQGNGAVPRDAGPLGGPR